MSNIVLVSRSPRRVELLTQIGVEFETVAADIDESVRGDEEAETYVRRLSLSKIEAGKKALSDIPCVGDFLLIGADTAVVIDDRVLGKPANKEQAIGMLQMLSGRTHKVLTGLAMQKGSEINHQVVETLVTFRRLTVDESEAYWKTGEPSDKAGSYAIQGKGALFVSSISGSYSNVVGLPLYEVSAMFQQFGVECLS